MEIYGLKQKKKKKWWLIPLIIIAVILAVILVVGIIVNVTNAEHDSITAAVSENAELRRQIDDLNAQINDLEEQLSFTQSEIDARPTVTPEETLSPEETPETGSRVGTSPRNYEE